MRLQSRRQSWTERCCKPRCGSSCSSTARQGTRPIAASKR
uniref:Uncharacterized protein n=1 Tax=Siphoviridae sp. ctoWO12 TaxID=2826461 RepID=A0A8S5QY88_9CAUD|nr:MAG TPA: hypothetical protein [Siphoviridae sp. ctoWO12]